MKGFGAVVTGTLIAGDIGEGDELELLPAHLPVRVRGAQVHGQSVTRAQAGQRTAVNLGGIDVSRIERGMTLAPAGRLRPTQIIDAELSVLPSASRSLRSRARVRVHIGAIEVLGRVRVLDETGELAAGRSGLVQLRLDSPVVALHGDRFIVRAYSPPETIAGGIVLDPFASKHRGKQLGAARERLRSLMTADRQNKFTTFVELAGDSGLKPQDLTALTGWTTDLVSEVISEALNDKTVVEAGGVTLAPDTFARLSRHVVEELENHHKREPLSKGMLRETLRERTFAHLPSELFVSVLSDLELKGAVVSERDTVRVRDHSVDLSEKDTKLRESLEQIYLAAGVAAPSLDEAMTRGGITAAERVHGRKILQLLIDAHKLVRVQGDMFMHANAVADLKAKLLDFAAKNEPDRLIEVAEFKDLAGVSRKYAIPLLEYFDRERVTQRAGDKRLILK